MGDALRFDLDASDSGSGPGSDAGDGGAGRAPPLQTFKVTVLGDGSVGKSSICNRFCQDFFAAAYKQTIGLDFFTQTITLDSGARVVFNLHDIGGQSLGSRMLQTYIAGSAALIFVYDLTNSDSLESVREWHRVASCYGAVSDGTLIVLVGNKSDLASERTVRAARSEDVKAAIGARLHMLVSACTGDRVAMLFIAAAGLLVGADVSTMMIDARKTLPVRLSAADMRDTQVGALNTDGLIGDAREGRAAVEQRKAKLNQIVHSLVAMDRAGGAGADAADAAVVSAAMDRKRGRCAVM